MQLLYFRVRIDILPSVTHCRLASLTRRPRQMNRYAGWLH